MARKPFPQEARAKGYKALLRSTSKRAEGLKAYARKWLREHGYSASIVLLALMCLAAPASAQRANTLYADQFRDRASTVGGMVTLAQQGCAADTAVPCQIVIDGILAVFPTGVIPVPCAQCIQIDYRTIGQVKVANAANTTLTQVWPSASTFPLLGPNDQTCNPAKSFGTVADGTGLSFTTGVTVFCFGTIRRWAATSTVWEGGSGGIYCWGSAIDATGACDTGLSRDAVAGVVDVGTGAQGSAAGSLKATNLTLTGTCTGCGGAASSVMTAGCSGIFTASSTIGLFQFGGDAATCTSTYISTGEMPIPRAGTIQNFRLKCVVAGVLAGSGATTMQKNNTAQTVTCTTGTTSACTDLTHTFAVVAGDTIGVKIVTQAGETLDGCHASWELL